MQKAFLLHASRRPTVEVLDLLSIGMVQYLALRGFLGPTGRKVSAANLWSTLGSLEGRPTLAVRRLFRDRVLYGRSPWEQAEWTCFCQELADCLPLPDPAPDKAESLAAYLAFAEGDAIEPATADPEQSRKRVRIDGVTINLGSIHSVKGQTVDAILVAQSEIHRGPKATQQVADLEVVLPHAFGIANADYSANEAHLAAGTNVFVGITRTRELLALALRRDLATDALLAAAGQQGWHIRDLTTG